MDDDNYVNVRALLRLLAGFPHTQDLYIGKPSLDRPIQATERVGENKLVSVGLRDTGHEVGGPFGPPHPLFFPQRPVHFWFATGGAGFCISRGLALKMRPWAR